jgi:LEA14-like dessication related protein
MFFFLSLYSACSLYKPVTYGTVEKIELKSITVQGVTFDLFVPVKNPNSYAISVLEYNFDVEINEMAAGNVRSTEKVEIPAHSDSVQKISVTAKITNILAGINAAVQLFSQPETTIRIKGKAKAKALFLKKNIKIDQTEKVKIFKTN